ncbi:2-deoxyribose-5-phosphate aldolase [Psittacicella hinzii]|uniref:deoxyribose-phosphate aldolase n=1 Tax=Psittacicella hinzii TaxID=2028575 RepID=A0A3A1YSF4_9GAMM|nr:deoxyribose-phosphate aldolase [Psittacicella hinzii]RIY38957.1 hypothetical protein CKF58_03060 [Psittacicella hinzii]
MFQNLTPSEQAKLVLSLTDLTSLNDSDTYQSTAALCEKANSTYGQTAAVCVYKQFAGYAKEILQDSIPVATVINFPDGALDQARFNYELAYALEQQVDEIDYVFPWRKLQELTAQQAPEFTDIQTVKACPAYQELSTLLKPYLDPLTAATKAKRLPRIKVILESGSLTPFQIALASQICIDYQVDFIKTSTGKHGQGATLEAAKVIFNVIKANNAPTGFKASGGVSTVAQAMEYINLAASILGEQFIKPETFRFGASGIFNDIKALIDTGKSTTQVSTGY